MAVCHETKDPNTGLPYSAHQLDDRHKCVCGNERKKRPDDWPLINCNSSKSRLEDSGRLKSGKVWRRRDDWLANKNSDKLVNELVQHCPDLRIYECTFVLPGRFPYDHNFTLICSRT